MNPNKELQLIKQIESASADQTFAIGKEFSQTLKKGELVCFYGNLGTGKTTFIKGLCDGLNVTETVNSPTFTLINEYHGTLPVFHFDFYRISDERELNDLGLEEYFESEGICLIEWPDIIESRLPASYFRVMLEHDSEFKNVNKRSLTIQRAGQKI